MDKKILSGAEPLFIDGNKYGVLLLHGFTGSPYEMKALADLFAQSPFPLFTEQEWIELVCDFLERLRPDIVIQRLVGDAKPGTLIAPKWKMLKVEILQKIREELELRQSFQGYRLSH